MGSETEIQKAPNSTKKHIRGSALLFGGRLVSIIIKFFLQILIVRYLSKSDYGAFAYAINIVEIAAILSLVSLDKAGSRYMPIYDEEGNYDSLFGFIVLSFITVFGVGLAIILLIFGFQGVLLDTVINDPLIISLLLILITLAPLQAIDSWFHSFFAAFNSVKAIFFRRYILFPGLQLLTVLLVIWTQSSVQTLAWGYLIGGVVGTFLYGMMMFNLFKQRDLSQYFSLSNLRFNTREIFGFSLPALSSGLAFILRSQIVIILLQLFRDTDTVAEFRAVLPIANLNNIVYSSFIFLYMPLVARMLSGKDERGINDLFWRTSVWISIASLPVFLLTFVLADPLVLFFFGERYASSGSVMAVLALGIYLHSVMGFNTHTLMVYGEVKYILIMDVVTMIIAVIAYWLLIPSFGALGGALGYSIAVIVSNILIHIGLIKFTEINIFDPLYMPVYLMIIIATATLWLVQSTFQPPLYLSVPFAAILSLAILYLNRARLQIGEIFPELLKVPILKDLL